MKGFRQKKMGLNLVFQVTVSLCFGFITVHRNVELESNEEMKAMELGIKDTDDEGEEKKRDK